MDIDEPWARIVAWVTEHAPTSAAELRPPAPPEDLAAARAAFARPWPRDLVRLYELCDGTTGPRRLGAPVLPLMAVLPLTQLLTSRRTNLEVAGELADAVEIAELDAAPAGTEIDGWLPSFVPFAEDGGGDALVVDLRGGPMNGSIGRWLHADVSSAAVWPSLTVLLDELAHALTSGSTFDGWIAGVDSGGALDWDVARG